MKKQGFEFTFTWLFVIIVGATILILAVFMASRLINRESTIYNTEVAAELGAALTPIETGIESAKYYPLAFPSETRLTNECIPEGTFGRQELSVSVRSGVGEEWSRSGIPYRTSSTFIFSPENFQGKQVHVVATPIKLPYEIGNALVMYPGIYCFVDPPEDIEDEIISLGADGMEVVEQRSACTEGSVRVCFQGSGCDVHVLMGAQGQGSVQRGSQSVQFIEGLFYAAVVADKTLYDCQVTRIRKRASELAQIYAEKSTFLDARGCSNSLTEALVLYREQLLSSAPLTTIMNDAEVLERANERLACRLF